MKKKTLFKHCATVIITESSSVENYWNWAHNCLNKPGPTIDSKSGRKWPCENFSWKRWKLKQFCAYWVIYHIIIQIRDISKTFIRSEQPSELLLLLFSNRSEFENILLIGYDTFPRKRNQIKKWKKMKLRNIEYKCGSLQEWV